MNLREKKLFLQQYVFHKDIKVNILRLHEIAYVNL
jgi:hypothetical protein